MEMCRRGFTPCSTLETQVRSSHNAVASLKDTRLLIRWAEGRVGVEPLGKDDIYIADVKLGNPPQILKMALDTGSSDL